MPETKDITGKKFGSWTVLKMADKERMYLPDGRVRSTRIKWWCKCECGNEVSVYNNSLVRGLSTRCMKCAAQRLSNIKVLDRTGKRYGRLLVLERSKDCHAGRRGVWWTCKCDCGNITEVYGGNLGAKKTISCGCYGIERTRQQNTNDLTGKKFGRLTVLRLLDYKKYKRLKWRCRCDCGNIVDVFGCNLVKGQSSSCGCYSMEVRSMRIGPNSPVWKGGISCDPYCDAWADKEYKQDIKDRDNNECQNHVDCRKTAKRIAIHHIDYDKLNCSPWNLITLCTSCNSRANFNRDYWQKLYIDILIKRGLYNAKIFEQNT